MNDSSQDIAQDSNVQIKALKRELKQWEHQFLADNGRKPTKKDIAAVAAIGYSFVISKEIQDLCKSKVCRRV
jgi:hypothetical protein